MKRSSPFVPSLSGLFVTLAISAVSPAPARAATTVVARVNSSTITTTDVLTYAASRSIDPEAAVHELVDVWLLAAEGERLGLGKSAEVAELVAAEQRRAGAALFVENEINFGLKVPDGQLHTMFVDGASRVKLQSITLATKEDAQAALDRLRHGSTFATESKSAYDPSSVSTGGDLGWVHRSRLEEPLAKAAFSAKVGDLFGPIQLALGWAVIRVQDRELANEADFKTQLPSLRKFAEAQAKGQARNHYVMLLRKQQGISVDDAFLKSTGTSITPKEAEAAHVIATVAGKPVTYVEVLAALRREFGATTGGHASGPSVKLEFAWSLVDAHLLENAAASRGWMKDPSVVAVATHFRPRAIAQTVIDTIIRGKAPTDAGVALQTKLDGLRAHAKVSIDEHAVAALMVKQ